jgi:hypothetical protein
VVTQVGCSVVVSNAGWENSKYVASKGGPRRMTGTAVGMPSIVLECARRCGVVAVVGATHGQDRGSGA